MPEKENFTSRQRLLMLMENRIWGMRWNLLKPIV